jgi:hypothetical protein
MRTEATVTDLAADEGALLQYVRLMARTARVPEARRLFQTFLDDEERRLKANGTTPALARAADGATPAR